MKWLEWSVDTTTAGLEVVYAALSQIGIQECVIEDGAETIEAFLEENAKYWDFADVDELSNGHGPCIKAYFADEPERMAQLALAKAELEKLKNTDMGFDLGSLRWRERWVDMEDWANNWKTYYKPLEIGERLLVRPSWETVEDPHGRTVLAMDPGMAFGTGEHHTTRMCLELLEACVKENDRVLDVGCGSGILSIAALLMGASDATAVDIDPIARNVVADNRKLNGIADDTYHLHIGDILTDTQLQEAVAGNYDIVLANIVADVIIALTPQAARYCRPGGLFIVSGIIDTRENDVRDCLTENGFDVQKVKADGGWVAMQATRRREEP